MKIFQWMGEQFQNNMFNMLLYGGACLVIGWFTGPLVPGVNKVVANMCAKHVGA